MQPQQSYPQPPQYPPQPTPAGGDDQKNFDFILNPEKPPKKPLFSFGSGLAGKLLLILGGIFIVVIILAVVANVTKNSSLDRPAMITIAQDQTEILRLVKLGSKSAKSQALVNFNATAAASTATDQTALITYASKNGLKLNEKELALTYDATADTQLDTAVSAGTFDTTYKSIMDKKLSNYQADLTAAYKNAGPKGKTILKAQYNNAKLLRTQLNS